MYKQLTALFLLASTSAFAAAVAIDAERGRTYPVTGEVTAATVTPPGADTQVAFNDGGDLGADAGLTYNKTTDVLTSGGGFSSTASNTPYLDLITVGSDTKYRICVGSDGGNDNDDSAYMVEGTDCADETKQRFKIDATTGSFSLPTDGAVLGLPVKTDAGEPAGANGSVYYSDDLAKMRCYEDDAWKDCIATTNAGLWSGLQNPTGNLSLAHGAYTSTMTWGNATSTGNLLSLTDTTSNTGTGYMLDIQTQASSTVKPLHISAAGVEAITILADGKVGFGTATPNANFHVAKTSAAGQVGIVADNLYEAAGSLSESAAIIMRSNGAIVGSLQTYKTEDWASNPNKSGGIKFITRLDNTSAESLRLTPTRKLLLGKTTSTVFDPQFDFAFDGQAAKSIGIQRHLTSSTAGNNLTISAGGSTQQGMITALNATPTAGGTGYVAGDILTITTGGTGATAIVTTVSGGAVTAVSLLTQGSAYTSGTGKATSGGTGTGATLNITTVLAATDKNGGNLVLTSGISTGTGTSAIQFQTPPAGSTGTTDNALTTRMTIAADGTVGVGVAPTLGMLHIDKGTGVGQVTLDGSTGGCMMYRDTDDAGWTECDALDGVISCSTDADGVCD